MSYKDAVNAEFRILAAQQGVEKAKEWWSCGRKKQYHSRKRGLRKGFTVYKCQHCRMWHRAAVKEKAQRG